MIRVTLQFHKAYNNFSHESTVKNVSGVVFAFLKLDITVMSLI